jgi:hypothetical protein
MDLERVDHLAGIPLFYDRFKEGAYGDEAVPMRPFIDRTFLGLCNSCFQEMQDRLSATGVAIAQIWSGGVGREGNGQSYHHRNRAFDLDALIFEDAGKWVASTFPERPFIYLAIEACLRMSFGTVLNHDYNAAHKDHLHFDNGTAVRFKRDARSHALFVQHTLVRLFNHDVGPAGFDGVFGPDTEAALTRVRSDLGIGGLSEVVNWKAYLRVCMETALDFEQNIVRAPDLVS